MHPAVFGLLLVAVGVFCVAVAGFDWDFVMQGRKVRSMVSLIGRGPMRVVYAVIGVGMVVFGVVAMIRPHH